MTDPMTVGAFVVSVLTMAGEATVKGLVGEAAKEAYKMLKSKLETWASGDVEKHVANPSDGRKLVVMEAIDAQPEPERAAVERLAQTLQDALKRSAPAAVGMDVDLLRSGRVDLTGLHVVDGIGLRARTVETDEFVARGVTVGATPEKKSIP